MANWSTFVAVTVLLGGALTAEPPSHWQLQWSDEFDGPAASLPDASKWNFEAGGGGWGNNEEEVYHPGKPNVFLDGSGHLVVEAVKSSGIWTSGRINTKGKEQVQYGRIGARMKLPQGAGVWPAFWMLGTDIDSVGWPKCGELDVMENVPMLGPTKVQATIHGPASKGKGTGLPFTLPVGEQVNTGFHTYGIIWSPGRTAFYVDDFEHPFFTLTKETAMPGDWVYDHPFFIILNLAIGGDWPGPADPTTPNPAVMTVDWVRVYKQVK